MPTVLGVFCYRSSTQAYDNDHWLEFFIALEEDRMRRVLKAANWTFETLFQPSLEHFFDELIRLEPTIVHFSGHGGEGVIWMNKNSTMLEPLDIDVLISAIDKAKKYHGLQLAILNCCHSASLYNSSLLATVGPVIGMVGTVQSYPTQEYSKQFYNRLVKGRLVTGENVIEAAHYEARRDWFTPEQLRFMIIGGF